MKKICLIYLLLFFAIGGVYSLTVNDSVRVYADSVMVSSYDPAVSLETARLQPLDDSLTIDTIVTVIKTAFKPDPMKSVWMGAIIPGYGQIANRKYWKLPIVYGGFLGFAYAISWNNSRYTSYKNGYRDISDTDPTTNYHLKMLPRGYSLNNYPGGVSTYQSRLKSGMEAFRRYRDLSILLSVGYYALVLLDAYVDAQLYDFDITPDLVLNVVPTRIETQQNTRSAYGVQCSIRF